MENEYLERIKEKLLKQGKFTPIVFLVTFLGTMLSFYIATSIPLNKIMPDYYCKAEQGSFTSCSREQYCLSAQSERKIEVSILNWVSSFALSCEKMYLIDRVVSANYIGSVLYTLFLGMLQDKIGRVAALKYQSYVIITLLFSFLLISDFSYFPLLVLLMQLFNGYRIIFLIYSKEVLTEPYFNICTSIANSSYASLGLIQILGIYLFADWRVVHLTMTLLILMSTVLIINFFPESPQYYLYNRDKQSAKESLIQISYTNQVYKEIEHDLRAFDQKIEIKRNKNNAIDAKEVFSYLASSSKARYNFATNCLLLSFLRLIGNGIMIQVETFSTEVYFTMTMLILTDFVGSASSGLVVNYFGRMKVLKGGLTVISVFGMVAAIFKTDLISGICMNILLFSTCWTITPVIGFVLDSVENRYTATLFTYAFTVSQLFASLTPWILNSLNWYFVHGVVFICLAYKL